jgi:hypothetical protein
MASRRRSWDSLSPSYRARLSRGGITKARYERGDSLTAARGHSKTPEHPERAQKNPQRYRKYLQKRATPGLTTRDKAYYNFHRQLSHYFKYNDATVREGCYNIMTIDEARWTITADVEEIRSRAGDRAWKQVFDGQFRNPWWYH